MDPIVITGAARTPMGGMQGALAEVPATDLGAAAVKAAVPPQINVLATDLRVETRSLEDVFLDLTGRALRS